MSFRKKILDKKNKLMDDYSQLKIDQEKRRAEKIRRRRLKNPEGVVDEIHRGLAVGSSPFEVARNVTNMRKSKRMLKEGKFDESDE